MRYPQSSVSVRKELLVLAAVFFVLCDSLFSYYARQSGMAGVPVNAMLPLFVAAIVLASGLRMFAVPVYVVAGLIFGVIGFLLGIVTIEEVGVRRVFSIASALSAFFIGVAAFKAVRTESALSWVLLVAGALYSIVCVIALKGWMPAAFPVIYAEWSDGRVVHLRPEVTTDQNFQVFYLLPLVPLLALPYKTARFWLTACALLGAFFTIAMLQTRSGFLVMAGALAIAWAIPFWVPSLGRIKQWLIPVLLLIFIALNLDAIVATGSLLMERMSDLSDTGSARLASNVYLLTKLFDITWWVPQGNGEFLRAYGDVPHSNMTAMFMEGGIFGLGLWLAVYLWPIIILAKKLFGRQLDAVAAIAFVMGVSSFIVQLSLNVPFFEQTWLWAGAVIGANARAYASPGMSGQRPAPLVRQASNNGIWLKRGSGK